MTPDLTPSLPGFELLQRGLQDLSEARLSVEALLLYIGRYRLESHGIILPRDLTAPKFPEHALFDLLETQHGAEAFRLYRSLIRRLHSLENALDVTQPAR